MRIEPSNQLSRAFSLAGGLLACSVTVLPAASIFINENHALVAGGEDVAGAKLRASNNSWDQALGNGFGYSGDDALKTDVAGNYRSPGGRTFSFSFEHRAGEGFVMTITGGSQTSTLAWGTFSNAPGGTVVATLGGEQPLTPFDALEIEARSTLRGATVTFSNLVFNSPDLDVASGSFYDGTVSRMTRLGGNPRGVATQNVLADVNLANYTWSLTGTVNFARPRGNSGAEDVRFTVTARNTGTLAAVPEPGSSVLFVLCGGLAAWRRRR